MSNTNTKNLPWFRLYAEAVDDEKLRLLAFEDRWHYVAILCCKGQGILDESDPLMMRKVAVKMGLDVRTLEDVARRLAEVGLVDQATLQPIGWNGRQMRSDADPTAADRKRRQREREKGGNGPVTGDGSVTGRDGHGGVTGTDIDTEEEGDTEGRGREKSNSPRSGGETARATRLPKNWGLKAETLKWTLDYTALLAEQMPEWRGGAWDEQQAQFEADKFRDFWVGKSGKDGRKTDWPATWRNWVRNAGPKRGGAVGAVVGTGPRAGSPVNTQEAREAHNQQVAREWVADMQRQGASGAAEASGEGGHA